MVHPADTVVHQILLLEVLGHCHCAVVFPRHLPHKLLVVELLPEQDVELRLEPLSDAPLLDEQVLVLSPRRDRLQKIHQFGSHCVDIAEERGCGTPPEEVEGADPVLRQPMQGRVGLHHGEGVAKGASQGSQPGHERGTKSKKQPWSILSPQHFWLHLLRTL